MSPVYAGLLLDAVALERARGDLLGGSVPIQRELGVALGLTEKGEAVDRPHLSAADDPPVLADATLMVTTADRTGVGGAHRGERCSRPSFFRSTCKSVLHRRFRPGKWWFSQKRNRARGSQA